MTIENKAKHFNKAVHKFVGVLDKYGSFPGDAAKKVQNQCNTPIPG